MKITEDEKDELIVVDVKTGKVLEDARIVTREMDEARERRIVNERRIAEEYAKYGNFYWMFYDLQKPLFSGEINGATVTRLMYLATYMSYNSNKLTYENGKPVLRNQLPKVLNVSPETVNKFVASCVRKKIMKVDEDGLVYLMGDFKKGKIKKHDLSNEKAIVRIYYLAIQWLYEKSSPRDHKVLSYLFSILPWVNRRYNIICSNPEEKDLDLINPLSTAEMCEIIGYDKSQAQRLKSNLYGIRINGKPAISWVNNCDGEKIFINPRIYYAGTEAKEVKVLGKF